MAQEGNFKKFDTQVELNMLHKESVFDFDRLP